MTKKTSPTPGIPEAEPGSPPPRDSLDDARRRIVEKMTVPPPPDFTRAEYWEGMIAPGGLMGATGCTICGCRFAGQIGHGPPCLGHK